MDPLARRKLRGTVMAMVFQEPMTALHPAMKIVDQLSEVVIVHKGVSKREARKTALEKLKLVGMPEPEKRLDEYSHQLSGGMRQRVVIAMALMAEAKLFIADEPTTALDVTIQAQILELLKKLQATQGISILLITHDMGVVAEMSHTVCVMKEGVIVESGTADDVFAHRRHPYTQHLVDAVPILGTRKPATQSIRHNPLVVVDNLRVHFTGSGGFFGGRYTVRAVDGVSLTIHKGETLGLVGESGCGKSTIGRAILGILEATSGSVRVSDLELGRMTRSERRTFRRNTAMIFQDPFYSLNPRMQVAQIVAEPMEVHRLHGNARRRNDAVIALLEKVGLHADMAKRYPHEFSGGQRQRVGIARALALKPSFIVCDEPTSALDVSIQAEVMQLLMDLREEMGLTLLFISHDLAVIEQIAHRVAAMYLGKIVEIGETSQVISNPKHPYTLALLSAAPVPDPVIQRKRTRIRLNGSPPSPMNPPTGCSFHPRCQHVQAGCKYTGQSLELLNDGRRLACNVVSERS